jgi:hypothetical protein
MDFLLELAKLIKETPKLCLPCDSNENCPYNNFLYKSKDCHLCFSSCFLDSCYYLETAIKDRDCVDSDYLNDSELCYECVDCAKCYNANFSQDCVNCTDCDNCYGCHGCSNCFGCAGLRKKEFHIFNKRFSREEYLAEVKKLKKMPKEEVRAKVQKLREEMPHPALNTIGSENVFGDYVTNSKNCYMCFNAEKAEDSGYLFDEISNMKDCYDCDHVTNSELMYNSMSVDSCYNVNCSWWMVNCRDCEFGFCNQNCNDCFGCVYMQRHTYCILNKQYSKEEYFKKVAEIKGDLRKRELYGKFLLMDAVEMAKRG